MDRDSGKTSWKRLHLRLTLMDECSFFLLMKNWRGVYGTVATVAALGVSRECNGSRETTHKETRWGAVLCLDLELMQVG